MKFVYVLRTEFKVLTEKEPMSWSNQSDSCITLELNSWQLADGIVLEEMSVDESQNKKCKGTLMCKAKACKSTLVASVCNLNSAWKNKAKEDFKHAALDSWEDVRNKLFFPLVLSVNRWAHAVLVQLGTEKITLITEMDSSTREKHEPLKVYLIISTIEVHFGTDRQGMVEAH